MPENSHRLQPPQPPQQPTRTNVQARPASEAANTLIDIETIDKAVPLVSVEAPERRRHGRRLSKEHIERIERRHRRERFLFRLDMVLLIIVCMGGAATLIGLQALQ